MKRVLICGGAGFIGGHLANRLHADGHYVKILDRKRPDYGMPKADELHTFDLTRTTTNDSLFDNVDEVYQLACEVGGLGYIMDHANDATMLRNSALINLRVLEACRFHQIPKVFFASSACVYPSLPTLWRDRGEGKRQQYVMPLACKESDVPPANPDNEYAWEKVFSERLYAAYALNYGMQVRIARFHNCYGTNGTWTGGREKAPAAICRKVAQAQDGDAIEVWGDGMQARSFMYVDDAVEGIIRLMDSKFQGPVNIGSSEMVTVDGMVSTVIAISGKQLTIKHVEGPTGVRGRNSDNTLVQEKLNWRPSIPLYEGLKATYFWIEKQVSNASKSQGT